MRSVLCIFYLVIYLIIMFPVHIVIWIIGFFNKDLRYRIGDAMVCRGFKWEIKNIGAKITVKGKENIPDEACLFVPNHRSYFDILLLHTTSGKTPGFVAKKEMLRMPFLGFYMRDICCVFLDRKNLRSGVEMIKNGAGLIKSGHSMAIFPEGTRSHGLYTGDFKEGSMKMAAKADCPVVPVAIIDSDQLFEVRPFFDIKRQEVKVVYGKPFYIKDLPEDKRKKAGAYAKQIIDEMIEQEGGQRGIPDKHKK